MPTLREFIANRQSEVRAQIAALREEDRELKAALAAIEGAPMRPVNTANPSSRITIKDMILDVLAEKQNGGTADDVIEWVKAKHGVDVPRSSMSPQLSRLKAERRVDLDNSTKIWTIADESVSRPNENGEPEGSPEKDEDHNSSPHQHTPYGGLPGVTLSHPRGVEEKEEA